MIGALFLLCFTAYFLVRAVTKRYTLNSRRNTPPGPKRYPVVGNLLDFPTSKPWLVYDRWFREYGDMVYIEVLGQPMLLLGSLKRTTDLLERRSSNYSDRPRMPMLVELMHFGCSFSNMHYGTWWRRHRRVFHQHFDPNAVQRYQAIEFAQVHKYLVNMLKSPQKFEVHTRNLLSSIIINVTYGIQTLEDNDPFIEEARLVAYSFSVAAIPGRFMVDTFPILKYVPSWMPGAGFQRFAKRYASLMVLATNKPFDFVMNAMKDGVANACVTSRLIDTLPELGDPLRQEEEVIARNITAIAYLAGSDTTLGSALAFVLAMVLHPEVQRKAQREIDDVVGAGRLPDFKDRKRLVYVSAIMKEVMRWHQVTPLALPHSTLEDDDYEGYFIPKGTVVIGNAWSILHDPDVYQDPLEFNPDRYIKNGRLDESVPDPSVAAFGFGRRICPGRHLSNDTLYAMVSSTLALFDIMPPKDELGNSILPKAEFSDGLLSHPERFDCIIRPRSSESEALIRNISEI